MGDLDPVPPVRRARGLAPVIGALTAGKRRGDGLVRLGAVGVIALALLRAWQSSLDAERALRTQQHTEVVGAMQAMTSAIEKIGDEAAARQETDAAFRAVLLDRVGKTPAPRIMVSPVPRTSPDRKLPPARVGP